jgi:hypothetical protein
MMIVVLFFQDIHLAKRCYDLAAETSADAKVPVALALMKVSLLFTMKYLQEVSVAISTVQNVYKCTGIFIHCESYRNIGHFGSYQCHLLFPTRKNVPVI